MSHRHHHLLPLLLAVLPPLGALFVGTVEAWADGVGLLLCAFYLYHLVKVPWELYESVHQKIHASGPSPDPVLQARLRARERWLFLAAWLAPALGGAFLLYLQHLNLLLHSHTLTPTHVLLYIFAASIRPLAHLSARLDADSETLILDAALPPSRLLALDARVELLTRQIEDMQRVMVLQTEQEWAREEMEGAVESVAKAVRGYARHGERVHQGMEERVGALEHGMDRIEKVFSMSITSGGMGNTASSSPSSAAAAAAAAKNRQYPLVVRCLFLPVSVVRDVLSLRGYLTR